MFGYSLRHTKTSDLFILPHFRFIRATSNLAFPLFVKRFDDLICEALPATLRVGIRLYTARTVGKVWGNLAFWAYSLTPFGWFPSFGLTILGLLKGDYYGLLVDLLLFLEPWTGASCFHRCRLASLCPSRTVRVAFRSRTPCCAHRIK